MIGLLLFLAVYVGLAAWFTYTAYRMISGVFAGGEGAVAGFFAALPAAFLAVFMWKALFFIRAGASDCGVEVTPQDEPKLFAFLHEVADEVGAPRPHRVFLAPDVTAAVFYDLSVLNLLLPSKKNLVIGLGLVNALGRTEFKAVLAHEFGHFAQRSMAVGRWVYIGEQITGHIIAKRDALDGLLNFISSIDLRIAWIGWIMRLVVWSIRSTMESLFRLVILAHRALSREMEFQADLVAVSVTGSDALIHALYKLQPADEDWDRAVSFANSQLGRARVVTDLYSVQSRISELMRTVLNEADHGLVPNLPVRGAAAHRIFTKQIAHPPKMWSTHPPNTEREENAKRVYLPGLIDESPAWELFAQPLQRRESLTATLFESIEFEKEPERLSDQQAREILDQDFSLESMSERYRGLYLGRQIMLHANSVDGAYGEPIGRDQIGETLGALYPESVGDAAQDWRTLSEELSHLEAVRDGVLDSAGKEVHYRGESLTLRQLPSLIDQVTKERDETLEMIEVHDRVCRTAHHAAARYVAHGWQEYLESLTQLVHYAEHSEANLADAYAHTVNVTNMATASGTVGGAKLQRVMDSTGDLYSVMKRLDREAEKVELPADIKQGLEEESWRDYLDPLELPPPAHENLGQWLGVLDSWALPMMGRFRRLRQLATAAMLKAERFVGSRYATESETGQAPAPCVVPQDYRTLVRGKERKRQRKLDWWSRFTLADGFAASLLRFGVSTSILAAVVMAGLYVGSATIVIYNGLSVPVSVAVNGKSVNVSPGGHRDLSIGASRSGEITASSNGHPIETFEVNLDKGFATYVYNVAAAAPLVEWTAVYGNIPEPPPQMLGFQRWGTSGANHVFEDPPVQVKTKNKSGATRSVLSGMPDLHPQGMLELADTDQARDNLIRMRAMWDDSEDQYITYWLHYASEREDFSEILKHRLMCNPKDLIAMRAEQEHATEETRASVLARHRRLASEYPDDPDLQYIAIRALDDGPEQDRLFMEGCERWRDHGWFNLAAASVFAGRADWANALKHYEIPIRQRHATFVGAAVSSARIRRLTTRVEEPDFSDLEGCLELDSLLALETGDGVSGELLAFRFLEQGQIEAAYGMIESNIEENVVALILLAASKESPQAYQQAVLEIDLDEVGDPLPLIYWTLVAKRNGQSAEPAFAKLDEQYANTNQSPVPALRAIFEKDSNAEVMSRMLGLEPRLRGALSAVAVISRPETTPEDWKRIAKRLLFNSERPYF